MMATSIKWTFQNESSGKDSGGTEEEQEQEQEFKSDDGVYRVPAASAKGAYFSSFSQYQKLYKKSLEDTEGFWAEQAREHVHWFRDFDSVTTGGFETGGVAWFLGGKTNVCYNCIDRHLADKADEVAILWEGDEPDDVRSITFRELHEGVCRMANALLEAGIRKGDPVCIYMPMVPEAAYIMLACTRIGAPHSVVFAGFSAQALRDRILDCNAKVVVCADEGVRGGRVVPLKRMVDQALEDCDAVHTVFVWKRTDNPDVPFNKPRDVWLADAMERQRPYCPPVHMDSEDTLFMLYTSGSTGKPKGIAHTTGGYLTYVTITHKYVFDYRPGDIFACVADVGWITGHSYIVYGPLSNGATTFMFESTPMYPDAGRYWDMVQRHKITQFYTAPTAIRAVQRFGNAFVEKYDTSSLRVLGSVGEPINPEAWKWYHEVVGRNVTPIVDTYWQTETGGIVVTPLPGATALKPSAATFPFFGIELGILDKEGRELEGNGVEGLLVLKRPWPGLARTIFGDHNRYLNTYMTGYPGYYFTGDGARRDEDGYYFITGRVDDVLNVSGHRIGTAEVEAAIGEHPDVVESAVIGIDHHIKGQTMFAYIIVKDGVEPSDDLKKSVKMIVRSEIGKFASVEHVMIAPGLPKTRSGKIMRRLLRKIASKESKNLGDISTLADETIVPKLIEEVNAHFASRK